MNRGEPARWPAAVDGAVGALARRVMVAQRYNIGFPGATDVDFAPLRDLMGGVLLNNVGDPFVDGVGANHTKRWEREVVDQVADLFRAPAGDRWGYVTTGGSEGNLFGLWLASHQHRDARVFSSAAAHPSVAKAVNLMRLRHDTVRVGRWGELDYDDLYERACRHRDQAAVVVATAGTTMSEAVDDVRIIHDVLDAASVRHRFVHVDAALSGIPLALLDPHVRPGFDFSDGADSVSVSGHKFLGARMPCGVVVTRASHRARLGRDGSYVGSPDVTITNSRSGHTVAMLWYVLRSLGVDGLARRAWASRQLAAYLCERLLQLGWPAHRFRWGFTVMFPTPPASITERWVLANHGGWSHAITMPGVSRPMVDAFVTDMGELRRRQPDPISTWGEAA